MKKTVFLFFSILCISIVVTACQKESSIDKSSNNFLNNSHLNQDVVNRADPGVKIKVKAKLYRKIETRPRDGKTCDCLACFGVCDLSAEVEISLPKIIVEPNYPQNGKATIYFIDLPSAAESEFVIDEDISVPSGVLVGSSFTSLTFKAGAYQYDSTLLSITDNGQNVTSYGSVIIDIATQ